MQSFHSKPYLLTVSANGLEARYKPLAGTANAPHNFFDIRQEALAAGEIRYCKNLRH